MRFRIEVIGAHFLLAQDTDDIAMYEWNGTILGPPHSAYENRIFSLSIFCGDHYPGASLPLSRGSAEADEGRGQTSHRW